MAELIDPFDEVGDVSKPPVMLNNNGMTDPFDEPEQVAQPEDKAASQPQSAPMTDIVASKMPPASVDKMRQVFSMKPQEGIQSGIEDTIFQMGASAAGQVVGGLRGLGKLATGGSLDEAVSDIENTQQSFNEFGAPETKTGEKYIATLGDLAERGIDIARIPLSGLAGLADLAIGGDINTATEAIQTTKDKGMGQALGDSVMRESGSPMAAAAAYTLPSMVMADAPVRGARNMRLAKDAKIASRIKDIESGSKNLITTNDAGLKIPKDKKLLEYMVDSKGNVVKDPMVKKLSKQGYELKNLPSYRGANRATKEKLLEILKLKRAETISPSIEYRASDVAGNSVMQRYDYIKNLNRQAGASMDEIANSLKGSKIDVTDAVSKFQNSLKKMGVRINDKGELSLDYSKSSIRRMGGVHKPLDKVIEYMKEEGGQGNILPDGRIPMDAATVHELKKYIDNLVEFGKTGQKSSVRDVQNALKELRHNLDDVLDTNFPEYNQVNSVYHDTIKATSKLDDLMGKKINLADDIADTAVGTKLRGLTSNAQYRVPLKQAIDDIENTAVKYGAKFDDELGPQLILLNDLESIAGSSAKTSLQGQFENALGKSKIGLAQDAIKRAKEGVAGKDVEKAFDLMEDYLKRQPDDWAQ